jgi:retinol dehydrogenase-12
MENGVEKKTYVITGATSGIGLATAGLLTRREAAIIGVGRSPERCRAAEEELHSLNGEASVRYLVADLSIQAEVRRLATEIRRQVSTLDALINNAGTFTFWLELTPEGFETQWAVNYLAPFLLTHELLPLLKAAPTARVVTVSSASHYNTRLHWKDIQLRRHYNCMLAYKQTKLATVLFTAELNRRLGPDSTVRAFAADPGLVNTEIGLKRNPAIARWIWDRRRKSGISPQESAKGIEFLAVEPSIQDSHEIYWKHSHPKAPSPDALDKEAASRLWRLSAQMCGIPAESYGQVTSDG